MPLPESHVEIVEVVNSDGQFVVLPHLCRVNGQAVLVAEDGITINPGSVSEPATVTLTLLLTSLSIKSEQAPPKDIAFPTAAERDFLASIGPVEPVEPRFVVAPDGETTDCCSESHNSFNISVFNPAPERAADSVPKAVRRALLEQS